MPEHRVLFMPQVMPARIPDIGITTKVVSVPLLSGDTRGIPASTLVLDEKSGATRHWSTPTPTLINRTLNARLAALLGDLQRDYLSTSFIALSSSADELEAAVRQADCICCATSSTSPLFPFEWARARGVVVDSRAVCAVEAGELVAVGLPQAAMVEVGELLRRARAGAEEDLWIWKPDAPRVAELLSAGVGDVTIFKAVGLGAQDVAIAVATVDRAMEMGTVPRCPTSNKLRVERLS
ncbi:hypothetical protein EDB92DRAFT_1821027 [Lactarius akahatsu]|uniref:Uncharacterized protein n=1 Tax=Lactarius akahatsu TaxID=416441 RepID=A0AAD4L9I0_9AGAM|nr:hypothetical protein EDB92DRAFT_1821027 [Lactarius akahatsu]